MVKSFLFWLGFPIFAIQLILNVFQVFFLNSKAKNIYLDAGTGATPEVRVKSFEGAKNAMKATVRSFSIFNVIGFFILLLVEGLFMGVTGLVLALVGELPVLLLFAKCNSYTSKLNHSEYARVGYVSDTQAITANKEAAKANKALAKRDAKQVKLDMQQQRAQNKMDMKQQKINGKIAVKQAKRDGRREAFNNAADSVMIGVGVADAISSSDAMQQHRVNKLNKLEAKDGNITKAEAKRRNIQRKFDQVEAKKNPAQAQLPDNQQSPASNVILMPDVSEEIKNPEEFLEACKRAGVETEGKDLKTVAATIVKYAPQAYLSRLPEDMPVEEKAIRIMKGAV